MGKPCRIKAIKQIKLRLRPEMSAVRVCVAVKQRTDRGLLVSSGTYAIDANKQNNYELINELPNGFALDCAGMNRPGTTTRSRALPSRPNQSGARALRTTSKLYNGTQEYVRSCAKTESKVHSAIKSAIAKRNESHWGEWKYKYKNANIESKIDDDTNGCVSAVPQMKASNPE